MRYVIRLNDIRRSKGAGVRLRARTFRKLKKKAFQKVADLAKANAFKPFLVRTWSGEGVGRAICTGRPTPAPKVLCLSSNRTETLEFFANLRERYAGTQSDEFLGPSRRKRGRRKLREFKGYIDFSSIQAVGTGAAVVLTAFYHRVRKMSGVVPPTINLHEWSPAALNTLFELGFFETVGHLVSSENWYTDSGDVRTMKMMTGTNSTELKSACEAILELSKFIDEGDPLRSDIRLALNSALGEAMSNVAAHAYLDHTESVDDELKLWWVSASADKKRRTLRVVAYDQGLSIPHTFPKSSWAAGFSLTRIVESITGEDVGMFPYDPDYIQFAMGEGKSQTGEPGRGEGLPQMCALIRIAGSGSLTILSRGGVCCYRAGESTIGSRLVKTLEGTLIEWELMLPSAV